MGILPEKLPVLITEKKNGKKNIRYIKPIEVQIKPSIAVSSLSPLDIKKARATIPAPARKISTLKSKDWFLVMLYSPLREFVPAAGAEFYARRRRLPAAGAGVAKPAAAHLHRSKFRAA
jgi:hypothetical protein